MVTLASRHRRKERHFVSRLHRGRRRRQLLVHRDPYGLSLGERALPGAAARLQQRAQSCDGARLAGDLQLLAAAADLLAQAGEIQHFDLHPYSSEYARNLTVSPARIAWPGGLSTSPSAQAVDISTAESCVG